MITKEFFSVDRLMSESKNADLSDKEVDGMIEYLCVKISPESINAINNLSKNEPLKGYSFKNSSAWRKIHE